MSAVIQVMCDCPQCQWDRPACERLAVQSVTAARSMLADQGWTVNTLLGGQTVDYAPGHERGDGAPC